MSQRWTKEKRDLVSARTKELVRALGVQIVFPVQPRSSYYVPWFQPGPIVVDYIDKLAPCKPEKK